MYKIAITGKANTGKNTLSRMLAKQLAPNLTSTLAFADPIKEMIKIMFPEVPRKHLYGSSAFRKEAIPGAFKDGKPLTIRQCLIDMGTGMGRSYKESVWLDNFDYRFDKAIKNKFPNLVIVTDVRFRNEFDHLKNKQFYMIRLLRDSKEAPINHVSETSQVEIDDSEFNYVLDNNGTLLDLKNKVSEIVGQLKQK